MKKIILALFLVVVVMLVAQDLPYQSHPQGSKKVPAQSEQARLNSPAMNSIHQALRDMKVYDAVYLGCRQKMPDYLRSLDGVYIFSRRFHKGFSKGEDCLTIELISIPLVFPGPTKNTERVKGKILAYSERSSTFLEVIKKLDTMIINVSEIRRALPPNATVDLATIESTHELEAIGISSSKGIVYRRLHYIRCPANFTARAYLMSHRSIINPFSDSSYVCTK